MNGLLHEYSVKHFFLQEQFDFAHSSTHNASNLLGPGPGYKGGIMKRFRQSVSVDSNSIHTVPFFITLATCLVLIVAASPLFGSSFPVPWPSLSTNASTAMCTFSNPAYSGTCSESAPMKEGESAEAACGPILQCLNDVRCTKTYCGGTTTRGGWKLDSAKESIEKNSTLREK
jgi:hypothetical protein